MGGFSLVRVIAAQNYGYISLGTERQEVPLLSANDWWRKDVTLPILWYVSPYFSPTVDMRTWTNTRFYDLSVPTWIMISNEDQTVF